MDRATPTSAARPTWLRWAFVGMSLLLTTVVGAAILSSFIGARDLGDAIAAGQASLLEHTLRRTLPRGPPHPSDEDLAQVVQDMSDVGLRYVALVRVDGNVVAEAGEPSAQFRSLPRTPRTVERVGDRVRASSVLGPMPPRFPGLSPGGVVSPGPRGATVTPWGGPVSRRAEPRLGEKARPRPALGEGPSLRLVIELEPTLLVAMERRARRDLAIGLVAIVVMCGATALFWRLAGRAAAAEERLAAQRNLAALGEMSAVVAHELRNPLASLKGNAQLLQQQATDPVLARKARRIVDEAVRLQALGTGLLEFVRSGQVERTPTDVAALAREAAASSVAEVDLELDEAPAKWSLDAQRMRQVLVNLLDNGHHVAPEGRVTLRAREHDGALVVTVRDHGPGVPEADRAKIFEPFYTDRAHGTGLGLAVAQRIVELHGGVIACDDDPRGGAVFTVTVPEEAS